MCSGVEGGDGDNDIRVNRGLYACVEERDVYGYTRDGMLGGVSLELYRELVTRYPDIMFIASGGVGGMEDIRALENVGISSVIVGKAFYENLEFKI